MLCLVLCYTVIYVNCRRNGSVQLYSNNRDSDNPPPKKKLKIGNIDFRENQIPVEDSIFIKSVNDPMQSSANFIPFVQTNNISIKVRKFNF